jgi:hypothetical protein
VLRVAAEHVVSARDRELDQALQAAVIGAALDAEPAAARSGLPQHDLAQCRAQLPEQRLVRHAAHV